MDRVQSLRDRAVMDAGVTAAARGAARRGGRGERNERALASKSLACGLIDVYAPHCRCRYIGVVVSRRDT